MQVGQGCFCLVAYLGGCLCCGLEYAASEFGEEGDEGGAESIAREALEEFAVVVVFGAGVVEGKMFFKDVGCDCEGWVGKEVPSRCSETVLKAMAEADW